MNSKFDFWCTNTFIMIDLETTSANPQEAAITSIAMRPFNFTVTEGECLSVLAKGVIGVCGLPVKEEMTLVNAKYQQACMDFRDKHKITATEVKLIAQAPSVSYIHITPTAELITNMVVVMCKKYPNAHIVANHLEFDITILTRYFNALGKKVPWRYNRVLDLGSLILGLGKHKNDYHTQATHNAMEDCERQIDMLAWALNT